MKYRVEIKIIMIERDDTEEEIYAGKVNSLDELEGRIRAFAKMIEDYEDDYDNRDVDPLEAQDDYWDGREKHLREDTVEF